MDEMCIRDSSLEVAREANAQLSKLKEESEALIAAANKEQGRIPVSYTHLLPSPAVLYQQPFIRLSAGKSLRLTRLSMPAVTPSLLYSCLLYTSRCV